MIFIEEMLALQLSEKIFGVAPSEGGRIWTILILGDGFYELAAFLCMPETILMMDECKDLGKFIQRIDYVAIWVYLAGKFWLAPQS